MFRVWANTTSPTITIYPAKRTGAVCRGGRSLDWRERSKLPIRESVIVVARSVRFHSGGEGDQQERLEVNVVHILLYIRPSVICFFSFFITRSLASASWCTPLDDIKQKKMANSNKTFHVLDVGWGVVPYEYWRMGNNCIMRRRLALMFTTMIGGNNSEYKKSRTLKQ